MKGLAGLLLAGIRTGCGSMGVQFASIGEADETWESAPIQRAQSCR
jgi:hypothetical protein